MSLYLTQNISIRTMFLFSAYANAYESIFTEHQFWFHKPESCMVRMDPGEWPLVF